MQDASDESPVSGQRRRIGALSVCSQAPTCTAVPISYVATKDIGTQPVYDHKTGEELRPDLDWDAAAKPWISDLGPTIRGLY